MIYRKNKEITARDKILGVTIGYGKRYFEYAEMAAESVRRHTGINTFILTENEIDNHPILRNANIKDRPYMAQIQLFDFFDGTIFYFDADTYMLKDWDLSEYYEREEIVAVKDLKRSCKHDCEAFGLDIDKYINIGMFIATKRYHSKICCMSMVFSGIRKILPESYFREQTFFNMACQKTNCPILFLDDKYNYIAYGIRGTPNDVVVAHAAGGPKEKEVFYKIIGDITV